MQGHTGKHWSQSGDRRSKKKKWARNLIGVQGKRWVKQGKEAKWV